MNNQIKNGAMQYATFITNYIPQTSDGKLNYYFSGSLEMLLLSSAKSIKIMKANNSGEFSSKFDKISVNSEATKSFERGTRELSKDIDIVQIDKNFLQRYSFFYDLESVKEHCNLSTTLCPTWGISVGTSYFDILTKSREITSHNLAEIELENGQKIITLNPVDLMFHKLSEMLAINLDNMFTREKYTKDIKDLACIFNGVNNLELLPKNIKNYIKSMIKQNTNSGINYLEFKDLSDRFGKVLKDVTPLIEQNGLEKFKTLLNETKSFNQDQLTNSMQ